MATIMETVVLPHMLQHPLRIGLFEHVENASFLRQQLLDGNPEFEYAFVDAATLLSRQHILAACFRAINDSQTGQLKSRNVHSEIVFSLSPNNNIAESFRRFGISDDTKHVVAIKVGGDAEQIDQHLRQNIRAKCIALTDERIQELCDYGRVKKNYRIDATKEGFATAETFVLGSIALKGS